MNFLGLARVLKEEADLADIEEGLIIENPQYTSLKKLRKYIPPELDKELYFYAEDKSHYYVPRFYFDGAETKLVEGEDADINFDITPRDYQDEYFKKHNLYTVPKDGYNCVLNVPTGHGKTTMALYLMSLIKKKTLIVCETKFLINQWYNRATDFSGYAGMSGRKDMSKPLGLGISILSNNKNIDKVLDVIYNNNIILITLKGFNCLDVIVREKLQEVIGVTIMDEGHRLGAKTFYPLLEQMPSKHRIMLTATFRRKDSFIDLLEYSFGNVYVMENKLPKADLYFVKTDVAFDKVIPKNKLADVDSTVDILSSDKNPYETKDYLAYLGKINPFAIPSTYKQTKQLLRLEKNQNTVHLKQFLAQSNKRIRLLHGLVTKGKYVGRKMLMLSPFLDLMGKLDKKLEGINTFVLDGKTNAKMKPEDYYTVFKDVDLIIGSDKVVQEGMDVEELDTLFLFFPKGDIEQVVGRITRLYEDKKLPMVFVFLDTNSFCRTLNNGALKHNTNFKYQGIITKEKALSLL